MAHLVVGIDDTAALFCANRPVARDNTGLFYVFLNGEVKSAASYKPYKLTFYTYFSWTLLKEYSADLDLA